MRGFWRSVAACLQLLAALFGLAAAPATASGPAAALTYEQTEDRSNFISQVRKARQGDTEAQWHVGMTYARLGDPAHALPMLTSAAGAGQPRAATLLGWLYEDGRGTERSIDEAKRWYRLAAEQGEADAMAALGRLLLQEKPAEARAAARQLFRRAAELQDPNGQYYLGWTLTEAARGTRDDAEAYDWFLKAARQGHIGAQLAVATHLMAGRGVAVDNKAAGEWLLRAAGTQDPVAHYLLGRWREEAGEGSVGAARDSYRIAAVAGHREAQFVLACMLAKSGAEADRKEAAGWFGKADEAGHKVAANRLGELFRDGTGDLKQLDKARSLFQRAAERGDPNAMYNLAGMQNAGLGGPRDTVKALEWYARAADEGHEKASEVIGALLNSSIKTSALGLKGFWQ
ncbi:MAG: tetratricopeptide repeat protein [Proteobacteria bacterium]|nr:tetratricopeptide repeat protein [Pseudomonadota bacterium]